MLRAGKSGGVNKFGRSIDFIYFIDDQEGKLRERITEFVDGL